MDIAMEGGNRYGRMTETGSRERHTQKDRETWAEGVSQERNMQCTEKNCQVQGASSKGRPWGGNQAGRQTSNWRKTKRERRNEGVR